MSEPTEVPTVIQTIIWWECDSGVAYLTGKHKSQRLERFQVEKLHDTEIKSLYQQALSTGLQTSEAGNTNTETTTIEDWQSLKKTVLLSAESVLEYKPRNTRNEWFDQECEQAVKKRNTDRKDYLERSTRSKKAAYENSRRTANGIIKKKKRAFLNNIMSKAEEDFKNNNSREAYRGVNFFTKGFQPKTNFCKTQGELLAVKEKIMERWKNYFQVLLNPNRRESPSDPRLEVSEDNHEENLPTIEDTYKAIYRLSNNKAPGIDNAWRTAEVWWRTSNK